MRRRLCIGILDLSPPWKAILNQLGLHYEETNLEGQELYSTYSLIIVNSLPGKSQLKALEHYVLEGGAILEVERSYGFTAEASLSTSFRKTIINQSDDDGFQHLRFLDLYSRCSFHDHSEIFEGLVHTGSLQEGFIGFMGADPSKLLDDTRYYRKRFYSNSPPYPDEIVSTVSKKELLNILEALIRHLHILQSIPLVQKWSSPEKEPIFGFRIDSDFGSREAIDGLYKHLSSHQIKATWFLHVEAHEEWLEDFKHFEEQEIALHGYKHGTSKSEEKIKQNIEYGLRKLELSGFEVDGFCAPYGIWNSGLGSALEAFAFSYTSEFTYIYGGLPWQPENAPLQIPIHPICTGSLSRRGYSESDMASYFKYEMEVRSNRFEPTVLYHHPMQPGLEAFDPIFKNVEKGTFTNLTFTEIADFWKARERYSFEAYFDQDRIQVDSISETPQWLQVSTGYDGFTLIRGEGETELKKTPEFHYSNSYLPEPEVINELRRKDLSLMKTSILDWKYRIRL